MLALAKLPPMPETPSATSILSYLQIFLTLLSGEFNAAELGKVVLAAELTSPGWAGALNAILADAVAVFPDPITRPLYVYAVNFLAKLLGVTLTA
jgi:hypothetical protein